MDGRQRRVFFSDQSNHPNNMNPNHQQQQQNDHGLSESSLNIHNNDIQSGLENRLRQIRAQLAQRIHLLNLITMQDQLLRIQNNNSVNNAYNLHPFCTASPPPPPTPRWTRINPAATPYSPLAIRESCTAHGRFPYGGFSNYSQSSAFQRRETLSFPADHGHVIGRHDHDHHHHHIGRHHYDQYREHHQCGSLFFTSMEDVRGKVVMAAKDQRGSRFLQDKIMHGNLENINMIFSEIKGSLCSLMTHQFGFHFVQKLIDVVDDNKLYEILRILTTDRRRLIQVCADDRGTKVVQKLVDCLRTPNQESLLAPTIRHIAIPLTKSTNGNDVITKCLENFSAHHKKLILRVIAADCLAIARDKSGCCILQTCFREADDEIFNILVAAIIQNADTLSENQYGNYVVQYLIEMKKLEVNRNIADKFTGKFVSLSTDKHGSNVIEKLIMVSGLADVVDQVIAEILNSSFPLQVYQNQYGNYVVQTALKFIREGPLLDRLRKDLKDNEIHLQNHMCGRNVLQALYLRTINETIFGWEDQNPEDYSSV